MNDRYTHEDKKRLADKISTIKKKEYLFKILKIIKNEKQDITSNNNGLFMYFHNLSDKAYDDITEIIEEYDADNSDDYTDQIFIEKASYEPYATDEFPSQTTMSPKLKYSNKERNLLKRKRYDNRLSSDTKNVCYRSFDVNDISPSCNSENS